MKKPGKSHITRALRQIDIKDNSIVLVKHGTFYSQHDSLEQLVKAIKRLGLSGVIAAVVADLDDVRVLSEEEMGRLGWVRKNES